MQRIFSALVIAPLSAPAGFYVASFLYRLLVGLLFYLSSMTLIILYLLGIVDNSTPAAPFFPMLAVDWLRRSDAAFHFAGYAGALAGFVLVLIVAATGPAASALRRAAVSCAVVAGFGAIAGVADLWYGVTPYVDRLMPHSNLEAAQREVTCRLTVVQVAHLQDRLSGCIAEVEGVLVYEENMRRFAMYPLDDRQPTIKVYFFRGRRSVFSDDGRTGPPRYYDQVSRFIGKRVRVIGTAVNGALTSDVGHVVLADALIQ